MKMEAYYVVKKWDNTDVCDYVAGPFRWYGDAFGVIDDMGLAYHEEYSVVSSQIEVQLT